MITQRIVRQKQGSWRWQTPYRVHSYKIVPTANGKGLRWELVGRSEKATISRLREWFPEVNSFGGLGRTKIDTTTVREAVYNRD